MAKLSRIEVARTMHETALVPLFYHPDPEVGKKIVSACYEGGARVLEFTNRGDFAQEAFAEISNYTATNYPEMALGVGSIIDAGTAALFLQLGADFIVSPMLVEEIATVCNRRKVLFAPGCGTLTEITRAHELGAEIVKLFPGGTYGPGFIKAVLGPCPWASIMPTGGVSPDEKNMRQWLDAGAVCLGMGSKLITKELVSEGNFQGLKERVKETLEGIRKIRG